MDKEQLLEAIALKLNSGALHWEKATDAFTAIEDHVDTLEEQGKDPIPYLYEAARALGAIQ